MVAFMQSFKNAACALSVIAGSGGAASADVLYSNFGPNNSYDTTYGWTLSYGGPLGGDAYEDAVRFTVIGGDYFFDSAEVAVNHFWGPDLVHFNLHTDDGGVPGAVLDSTSASGVVTPGTLGPPMVANFGGDFILEEGRTYWLALRTEETDAHLSWAFNVVDDFGWRAWQLNNGPWNPTMGTPGTNSQRGVFRINGTVVPAPACYPNCDEGGPPPFLNVIDFVCFQARFAAGHPYADCDRSGSLNVNDFVCFQAAFAAGCP